MQVEAAHVIKAVCPNPATAPADLSGRTTANILQWGMMVYTAYPDTAVSPTIVVVLGTMALFLGMAEIVIDLVLPDYVFTKMQSTSD